MSEFDGGGSIDSGSSVETGSSVDSGASVESSSSMDTSSVDSGSAEVNDVSESQSDIETGGESSEGVQGQMESESEETETPEDAENPDYDNESVYTDEEIEDPQTDNQDLSESEYSTDPDYDMNEFDSTDSTDADTDEYEGLDPDNPDIGDSSEEHESNNYDEVQDEDETELSNETGSDENDQDDIGNVESDQEDSPEDNPEENSDVNDESPEDNSDVNDEDPEDNSDVNDENPEDNSETETDDEENSESVDGDPEGDDNVEGKDPEETDDNTESSDASEEQGAEDVDDTEETDDADQNNDEVQDEDEKKQSDETESAENSQDDVDNAESNQEDSPEDDDNVEGKDPEETDDSTESADASEEYDAEGVDNTEETEDADQHNDEVQDGDKKKQPDETESAENNQDDVDNAESDQEDSPEDRSEENSEANDENPKDAPEAETNDEQHSEDANDNAESADNAYEQNPEAIDNTEQNRINEEYEKNARLDYASYEQGQNDYGALGTCGPTSIANSLNRITESSAYTENDVLHHAMDNGLCANSNNPYEMGGTTTKDVVSIIDGVKDPDSNIHTEVYDYDNALNSDELADRLDDPHTVAMVGVDSATLWDQNGNVANSGLFQHVDAPSDHWITVDSPVRDANGNVTGFNVIDSSGGVEYVGKDKFESIYQGDANHTVTDPTAIVITNNGGSANTYTAPPADTYRAYDYKGSAFESDGGDSQKDLHNQFSNAENSNIESLKASETENVTKQVKNITKPYYQEAEQLAQNNETGRAFTDHKEAHVEMVAEKSVEAGQALKEAADKGTIGQRSNLEGHVALNGNVDERTIEGAAISHDTGMSGSGYALTPVLDENGKQLEDDNGKKVYEKDSQGKYVVHHEDNNNFDEIRNNHSLNSAINVLKNRELYKDAGFSDFQVDKMAAECMAHSKSSSGVSDLNSTSDWSDCFDRIDSTVDAYNNDHQETPITFDRSAFEGSQDNLGSLASETFALRVGDVSRDSYSDAIAQSGEAVHVDRSTLNNRAGSWKGEIENASITIGENRDSIDSAKSRQVHAGEQNIIDNHTFVNGDGCFTHEITVADGVSAPKCTQEALGDHLGELASVKDEKFEVDLRFEEPCDDYSKLSYEQFRAEARNYYPNVTINFPWDDGEAS